MTAITPSTNTGERCVSVIFSRMMDTTKENTLSHSSGADVGNHGLVPPESPLPLEVIVKPIILFLLELTPTPKTFYCGKMKKRRGEYIIITFVFYIHIIIS